MKTASGEYIYLFNGEPTGVSETFQIDASSEIVRTTSTRDASVFGSTILVETEHSDGRFTRVSMRFDGGGAVSAEYVATETGFQFTRSIEDEPFDLREITIEPGTILFPLMRVFQGPTILAVAEQNSETTVLVPFIENPNDVDRLLTPTFDTRTARQTGVSGDIRILSYTSKHYDDASEFHINADGLLTYYRFPQTSEKVWEVQLMSEPPA